MRFPPTHRQAFAWAFALLGCTAASAQTTIQWNSGADGLWSDAAAWSGTTVPGASDRAAIAAAVKVAAGGSSNINLLALDLSASNATALFDFSSWSYGVRLGNAVSNWEGGLAEFRTGYGLYGNGTGNTTLNIGSGTELLFSSASGTRSLYNLTVNNSGTIHATSGVLSISYANVTNQAGGLIHADGAEIDFGTSTSLTNLGTIRATGTNGTVVFANSLTTAGLGTVELVGGAKASLTGTLDNSSATLIAPTGGTLELHGGTVSGGTIATGALSFSTAGGNLSGTTLAGDLMLPQSTSVRLTNGTSFGGSNVVLGNYSTLTWQQSGSLTGQNVSFGAGASITLSGASRSLTIDSASTLSGRIDIETDGSLGTTVLNQGTINHTSAGASGTLAAASFTNSGSITNSAANTGLVIGSTNNTYNTYNTGTITVNATGASIYLDGNVDLTGGTVNATNGTIQFRGPNTTAHMNGGTLQIASGAHAYLNGTLDNSGATLNAPTSGTYELFGGTITGGSIAAGALTYTNNGGYLDGVTVNGDLTLPTYANVKLLNGSTFTGSNLTLGNSTAIFWQQASTLSGKALTFGNGAWIYLTGGNRTLTLDSGTTATGRLDIETDGDANTSVTNQGTLTYTAAGSSGNLSAHTLTNSGTIANTAANAGLSIGSTSSGFTTVNTGTITVNASGATIYLDGNVDLTGGTVNATNGVIEFRGTNTTAHLNGGTLQITASGHAYLNGTLNNSGATLNAPTSGTYELYGGTISGGTIGAGALTFTSTGGSLDGATVTGDLTLPNSALVKLVNGSGPSGTNLTLGNSSSLYWQQAGTLSGKAITFGNGAWIYLNGGNRTLTLDSGTTATGRLDIETDSDANTSVTNQGTLTFTAAGGSGSLSAPTLTNSGTIANTAANAGLAIGSTSTGFTTVNTGTITVNASGATIYLDGNVDLTGGTVNATNGVIKFRGTNTTAHLNGGTLQIAASGHAYLNGTLDNSSATLNAPASGAYELYGGTISGGTIGAGALGFTNYGGILDAALVDDDLTVGANGTVRLRNGSNFTGATASFGNSASLYWEQSGTLSGKTLNFGTGSYLYVTGANHTLTLDAASAATGQVQIYTDGSAGTAITLHGAITHTSGYDGYLGAASLTNSGTITNTATSGALYIGSTSNGYVTRNTGTIAVNGSNAVVYLDGDFDGTGGTLNATNGAIQFRGNNTTAHLNGATVNIGASGHVYLDGTLDNTAATLAAPATGIYELYGGTVNNGTIAAGALTFTPSAGTLNAVTILGDLTVPTNAYAYWTGGTTLGSAHAALTLGSNSGLYWKQSGTLTSNALTFGSGSYLYLTSANAALTFDATTTATGDVSIYSDSSSGTSLTNQGTITHTAGNGYLFAETFTNAGTVAVNGGTLYLGTNTTGSSVANNVGATLRINGGVLSLQPPSATPLVNHGLIDVQSGTLYTNGRLVNGSNGTFSGAGTISGNLLVSGGAISPGNSGIGSLTFNAGTLTVTRAATFAVDVGATTADQLVFQYPGANIDLGNGLLALSLNLLTAPTPNTTFNLITLTSGTYTISGTFAGLPNSGDTVTANFGGTAFTFSVNYQPNFVSLAYNPVVVPEPSTIALLLLGGVIGLAASRRRRRAA